MARQEGEKAAKEHGFNSLPVDPFEIAKKLEIEVEAKPPGAKGVSGGIIFLPNNDVLIFHASNIQNDAFIRFTVGHELGHYLLEGHPDEIMKTSKGVHASKAGFTEGTNSIELEADHFSAGLLMPEALIKPILHSGVVGLDNILQLADAAETSATSAAIRTAECCSYPVAIVVSLQEEVQYCFMSETFKELQFSGFLRKGSPLPDSATRLFNQDPKNVLQSERTTGECTLSTWFDKAAPIQLDEEVLGLGSYGFTLTVLSSDQLFLQEEAEDEEEEELIDSWTPKFS